MNEKIDPSERTGCAECGAALTAHHVGAHSKKMTADERAIAICRAMGLGYLGADARWLRSISAQITQAEQVARGEGWADGIKRMDAIKQEHQEIGFALAREMAAGTAGGVTWNSVLDLTNQIRALQPPEKGAKE